MNTNVNVGGVTDPIDCPHSRIHGLTPTPGRPRPADSRNSRPDPGGRGFTRSRPDPDPGAGLDPDPGAGLDPQGPLSFTATLFASRISDPIDVERSPEYVLRNLAEPTTNAGVELLATYRQAPFALTGTYTYVQARETVDGIELDVPQTPRHSAGIVGMWEKEDVGRVGIEWYFTGRQALEENPYRSVSEPYMILGALVEKQFGRVRLFVNGENLTDVRQSRWDPLLRPTRAADGRWTVDAWAPLEGRNINGGLRLAF